MKKYLSFSVLLFVTMLSAQKLKITEGDFDFLKGQNEVNVEFVYDNMKLLKDNLTNDEYVENHAAKLEEDTRGKGKSWEKSWYASRELIYAPKFLELMNRYFHKDQGIYFDQDLTDAQYTLIVDTVWVYPGWDAGIMKQPAKVSTVLRFVETANKGQILAEVSSKHAPGNQWGSSFDNEDRIGEGYAKTGKSFAKLILKKAF
jgi:hypothetical protein